MVRAAVVAAVCVTYEVARGRWGPTGIDKRSVEGPVRIGPSGLVADSQLSRGHGGPDKAVYVYADEDACRWAVEEGIDVRPGCFGENLRTRGLDVSGARIGDRWRVGTALLEVRMPRTPCENLSGHLGVDNFHTRFAASGRVGALCRVVQPGSVRAGDLVVVAERAEHRVTIHALAVGLTARGAADLLASGTPLAPAIRRRAQRIAAHS